MNTVRSADNFANVAAIFFGLCALIAERRRLRDAVDTRRAGTSDGAYFSSRDSRRRDRACRLVLRRMPDIRAVSTPTPPS